MKAFKKPISVKFQYILAPIVVETLEGPVNAGPGHVLITGVAGEQYPISQKTFFETYNVDEDLGVAYKRKVIVDAEQLTEPKSVKVEWSDDYLTGKPGDWLITNDKGSQWIVEEKIFEQTYEVLK